MMDSRRILIANLCIGKLGPDKTNLIGALLVTQFHLGAMSRADVLETSRTTFNLFVDEFQLFVSASFTHALSEARRYGLCLTLAHQYLDQLKKEISNTVMGNVGSMVSFRVGHRDAESMEEALGRRYPAHQFTGLSNGEAYVKLLSGGWDQDAFHAETYPPAGSPHQHRNKIIERSREKYASKREVIEDKIRRWFEREW